MKNSTNPRKIVIVGGGFGGIRAALDLASEKLHDTKIILISDKKHFEYSPALYRVVSGRSPLGVCMMLQEIFERKDVEVLTDTLTHVDLKEKTIEGSSGSSYSFDSLVLALGSETTYFDIPGLQELSFGFKSINDALRLKQHLHYLFEAYKKAGTQEAVKAAHIIVVGGGATGVELASELAHYTRALAKKHALAPSLITIDLIEAASRLAPHLPPDMSQVIHGRLHGLGINVFLNRTVIKKETEEVFLKDMEMKTKTVIWAAGVKPHHLYREIAGLTLDEKGRVLVDAHLRAQGLSNIFIVGDAASTLYAGMAQSAIHGGRFVARMIARIMRGEKLIPYIPQKPAHAIPLGPGWAAALVGPIRLYGKAGWLVRNAADFRFFLSVMPTSKALHMYQSGRTICESCGVCSPAEAL